MAGIDTIAKRYHPFIVCGLLATVAYFQGRGIASLIAEQIPGSAEQGSGDPEGALEAAKKSTKTATKTKSGSEVLSRNPFDSVTGPITNKPAPVTPSTVTKPVASSKDPPKCTSGEVTLIAGALDPAYSFAVITSKNESKMRRIGDDVDGKKIESIHGESVVLSSTTGDRCKMTMHDEKIGAGPTGVTPPAPGGLDEPKTSALTGTPKGGTMPGITKVSETEYVIEEHAEQKLTQVKQAFMKSSKVVDGQGLRLYRAAQTTILGQLGLKKGDMVKSVNGYDMSVLDQSTELYEKLPSSKTVQVVVEREGKPMTFDISVK